MITSTEFVLLMGKLGALWVYENVGGFIVRRWGAL